MQRLLEIILGLDSGFLGREGELSIQFNPRWPWQDVVGAFTWNLLLGLAALALVIWIYRREGRSRTARVLLGFVRLGLFAFVIALLNRPTMTLAQARTGAVGAGGADRRQHQHDRPRRRQWPRRPGALSL